MLPVIHFRSHEQKCPTSITQVYGTRFVSCTSDLIVTPIYGDSVSSFLTTFLLPQMKIKKRQLK